MNGDEEKIREKIQEWWEEPEGPQEEEWEEVDKNKSKKKPVHGGSGGGRGGRSQGPGRGRGYHSRGGGGGRGTGGDRRGGGRVEGRGRGGPAQVRQEVDPQPEDVSKVEGEAAQQQAGIPAPFANAPSLKGAWGARAPPPPTPAGSSAATASPSKSPQPKPEDLTPPPESNPLEGGMATRNDPTPSGLNPPVESKLKAAVPPSGNVWATKGSAHLIQAEKPKPPTLSSPPMVAQMVSASPVAPIAPKASAQPSKAMEPEPVVVQKAVLQSEPTLESGLPSSVSGVWAKQAVPDPAQTPVEIPSSPVGSKQPIAAPHVASVQEKVVPISPAPVSVPQPPSPAVQANVLNMGHWETGDAEDSQNLDFGFGSFGAENENLETNIQSNSGVSKESQAAAAASVSPARPPPGLSIGGMPPMPANAVLVHELENKLESATLSAKKEQPAPAVQDKPMTTSLPSQPNEMPSAPSHAPMLHAGGIAQPNYSQYGMAGMYNYTAAAGNGFVGMHTPAGPILAGGVLPQQAGKPQQVGGLTQPPSGPQNLPQPGLYGSQPSSAPSSGNAVLGTDTANASDNATAPTAGMPPGMPGAIPYANPALYYGQHQFHMGQHQGGIGYNYGYGAQFGGVAQGGFGYQQVMGQSGAYGAPHYDDQPPHQGNTHHSGGSGGYQKNSGGGYRGRNSHHNNNQYQNQYNPQQHGGYGGQPYGMGYHGDHFNQRGAYGPGAMGDPYGMQQGSGTYQAGGIHSGGGFQDEDHHKGKKGGGHRGNGSHNSSLQQFQQVPPHQLGAQQPFGLQGQGTESTQSSGAGGGWSNQAGWSGGAPSWQGS